MIKTIEVKYLARVEGEGALTLRLRGNVAESVELRIFEPPRLFEGILRGRAQEEAPDITSRICGICPVAYMMSACHAVEAAHGVVLPEELRLLRRLLYAGEWLESHLLHIYMLHAPDFLGYQDAIQMAKDHPELVRNGLRMKKAGNAIVSTLGGREVHPINIKVGGFYRAPTKQALEALLPELRWARDTAIADLSVLAGFTFPELERSYEFVALQHATEYPFNEGEVVSNHGLRIPASRYEEHFEEQHVPHSTALHSIRKGGGPYLVGPLARLNLNFERLRPAARKAAQAIGYTIPCTNPFKSLLARSIEVIHAFDEAVAIIEQYQRPEEPSVPIPKGAAVGMACTEAPRGLLYHRYTMDAEGLIVDAKIVPPTSQNQKTIEDDLFALAPALAKKSLDEATWLAEQAIRNYDPCISCSTHFLQLKIEQGLAP